MTARSRGKIASGKIKAQAQAVSTAADGSTSFQLSRSHQFILGMSGYTLQRVRRRTQNAGSNLCCFRPSAAVI